MPDRASAHGSSVDSRRIGTDHHGQMAPFATDATSLTLLGAFRLQVGSREVRLPAGAQRMTALLALQGRMSRSRLAGTLWPDSTEDRALASLRTAIWRVNQAVPGLVATTTAEAGLAASVVVDVETLVRRARAALQETPSSLAPLQHMLGDARELLPDWEEEWLSGERERLRQLQLHLQESLAERLTSEGRFGLALEVALATLRLDVLRESAHRSVIRIHLAEGNIGEARRAYATCRQVLRQELGVSPTPATASMLTLPSDTHP
ncbi:BTAD domain-containing putative transcriptional regulator [Streptomyces flavochromogenes]|uniref:BTAD domain-containing putative transcriptional regulator n=1 Tax=Streptomyces flavochromogenes TaxID=68199 RepID=A0ABW6Y0P4_9ACTN